MREIKLILGFVTISVVLITGLYFYSIKERLASFEENVQLTNLKTAEIYNKLSILLNSEAELKLKDNDSQTLIFVGDVMFDRGVKHQIQKNGSNYKFPFIRIKDVLQNADLLFGNLEGPISLSGKNQGSKYSFRFDPKAIEGLKFAGFDVMSLANNHIMDWGGVALRDTVDSLFANGIHPVGAGGNFNEANNPLIVKIGNANLAFLGFTDLYPKSFEAGKDYAGISSFDLRKVKKYISDIRKGTDIIIISLHWGEEYENRANKSQKKIARELIDAGADLIIGHHPHVVQEVEQYKNGWIFYSLGNFVFDQNFSEETMQGLLAKVEIKNKKINKVEQIKVKINSTFQPEIVSGSEIR